MEKLINRLVPAVQEAGRRAMEGQRNVSRTYKDDGSVLTRFDTELNEFLYRRIREICPDANIITEEMETGFLPGREYTFTIDPIDGTDSFSQGQPGWCVAVGILDGDLKPAGGIIYAPRWGTPTGPEALVTGGAGIPLLLNGNPLSPDMSSLDQPALTQTMISSRFHRDFRLTAYPGKIRNAGCAVLNILSILLYPGVTAALLSPLHIWDLAAAHAVLRSAGLTMEYLSGRELSYDTLVDRSSTDEYILAGSGRSIERLKSWLTPAAE